MFGLETEKHVLPDGVYKLSDAIITKFIIEADSRNAAFAIYFREYVNRFKYINSTNFYLTNPDDQEAYKEWISYITNYANNGGDMR